MKLAKVSLHNFRSYTDRNFDFSEHVTIIAGPNGVGKTNILEAIHVLLTGKSFRDSDEDLIRHDQGWWRIQGMLDGAEREVKYQPEQPQPKQLVVDGSPKGRFTYRHQLPVVLFEPDDLLMIHGSPASRRDYLDKLLMRIRPSYRTTLARYDRALLQRNNLLKRGLPLSTLRDAIFVWDIALAEYGADIQRQRRELVDDLMTNFSATYSRIANMDHQTTIVYDEKTPGDSQSLVRALSSGLEKDTLRSTTSIGPHRDDVLFYLNDKPVKQTASRGEVRTLVLSLKQLEIETIQKHTGDSPIYLLDDVFSELDPIRQEALIVGNETVQRIITTTNSSPGLHNTIDLAKYS